MTRDRGSREVVDRVENLVVCGDAMVTLPGEVIGRVEVFAGTLKVCGRVAGDVEVNPAGRVDIHSVVDGALRRAPRPRGQRQVCRCRMGP